MIFEVKETPLKLAEFWLSREEAADAEFIASLKPQYSILKQKGYLPVVYESGTGDPKESTYMLMKRNYEVLAKKQLSAE